MDGIDANGCAPKLNCSGDIDLCAAGKGASAGAWIRREGGKAIKPAKDLTTRKGAGLLTWHLFDLEPGTYEAQTQIPLYSDGSAHAPYRFFFSVVSGGDMVRVVLLSR